MEGDKILSGRMKKETLHASSLACSKGHSKGQWFLVSAVMVSGVFLSISGLFKTYALVDTSETARTNEDFYFNIIKQQFNAVVAGSDCSNMDRNIRGFRAFAEREMNNIGYRFYLTYTISSCASKAVDLGLLVASNRLVVYENVNPALLGIS